MLEMVERIRQHADLVRSCIVKIIHVVFTLRNAPRAAAHLLHRQQQAARIVQHCRREQHAAERRRDGEHNILRGRALAEVQIAVAAFHEEVIHQTVGVLCEVFALRTQLLIAVRVKRSAAQASQKYLLPRAVALHHAADDLPQHLAVPSSGARRCPQPLPHERRILHRVRVVLELLRAGRRERHFAEQRHFVFDRVHVVGAQHIFRENAVAFLAVGVKIVQEQTHYKQDRDDERAAEHDRLVQYGKAGSAAPQCKHNFQSFSQKRISSFMQPLRGCLLYRQAVFSLPHFFHLVKTKTRK